MFITDEIITDTLSMRFCRFGNPNGQPLVILPGVALKSVMLSAMLIEKQYQLFSADYDVFVFDRRTDMPDPYPISAMASDTVQAMTQLGLKRVDLYGVSQGGMIAQTIAARHPTLVRRLALCSTATYMPDDSILLNWTEPAACGNAEALVWAFTENVYSAAFAAQNREALTAFAQAIDAEDLQRFLICVRGTSGFDIRTELQKISCPVLVIGAEQDLIFGTAPVKEIAEKTGAKLCIYPDRAHSVYDEEPDVLMQLKAFLDAEA